jgi:hypothetical protein
MPPLPKGKPSEYLGKGVLVGLTVPHTKDLTVVLGNEYVGKQQLAETG